MTLSFRTAPSHLPLLPLLFLTLPLFITPTPTLGQADGPTYVERMAVGTLCSYLGTPLWERLARTDIAPLEHGGQIDLLNETTYTTSDSLRYFCHGMHALAGSAFPLPTVVGTLAARCIYRYLSPPVLQASEFNTREEHNLYRLRIPCIPTSVYQDRESTYWYATLASIFCGIFASGATYYVCEKNLAGPLLQQWAATARQALDNLSILAVTEHLRQSEKILHHINSNLK